MISYNKIGVLCITKVEMVNSTLLMHSNCGHANECP